MAWSNVNIDTCIKHYIYTQYIVYMHAHSVWIYDKLPGKQTTFFLIKYSSPQSHAQEPRFLSGVEERTRLLHEVATLLGYACPCFHSNKGKIPCSSHSGSSKTTGALGEWCGQHSPFGISPSALMSFFEVVLIGYEELKVAAAAAAASAAASVSLATPTLDATQKHWKRGTVGGKGQGYPFSKAFNRGFCLKKKQQGYVFVTVRCTPAL